MSLMSVLYMILSIYILFIILSFISMIKINRIKEKEMHLKISASDVYIMSLIPIINIISFFISSCIIIHYYTKDFIEGNKKDEN